MQIRPATAGDLPEIERLLAAAGLPLDGVAAAFSGFRVAIDEAGGMVGAIGVEAYGEVGLLRSAVVSPAARGRGIGARLVEQAIGGARERGLGRLYLLTTTAEEYFPRYGFRRVSRADVPPELLESPELRGACPTSAVVMRLDLRAVRAVAES